MFNILSILLFGIVFAVTTYLKGITGDHEWSTVWLVGQILSGVSAFINILVLFYNNLEAIREFKEQVNDINYRQKKIALLEEKASIMKASYEQYFAKLYPEYEKDIFEKICSDEPSNIIALFKQYPELKTSVVIKKMVKEIRTDLTQIYDAKCNIQYEIQRLYNIKNNPWHIWLPEIPKDL